MARLLGVLGGECSGKTTLAHALARASDGLWVPETLRQFCTQHGRNPRQDEQAGLMAEQVAAQTHALAQARAQNRAWVFCDGAPLLTAVYSLIYFDDASLLPKAQGLHARYAGTLLLAPDFPWQADGALRDGDALRQRVHERLLQVLSEASGPLLPLRGGVPQRVAAVLEWLPTLA